MYLNELNKTYKKKSKCIAIEINDNYPDLLKEDNIDEIIKIALSKKENK